MTEKQYRLNKWGTRLLKNNRPLFDWINEADDIVDLLNELHEENEGLKIDNKQLVQFIMSKGYELKDYLAFIGQFQSIGVKKEDWE